MKLENHLFNHEGYEEYQKLRKKLRLYVTFMWIFGITIYGLIVTFILMFPKNKIKSKYLKFCPNCYNLNEELIWGYNVLHSQHVSKFTENGGNLSYTRYRVKLDLECQFCDYSAEYHRDFSIKDTSSLDVTEKVEDYLNSNKVGVGSFHRLSGAKEFNLNKTIPNKNNTVAVSQKKANSKIKSEESDKYDLSTLLHSTSQQQIALNLIKKIFHMQYQNGIYHTAQDLKEYASRMVAKYDNDECILLLSEIALEIVDKYEDLQSSIDVESVFFYIFEEKVVRDGNKEPFIFFEDPSIQILVEKYL